MEVEKISETAVELLIKFREEGFLFHGSNNSQIEKLEPRYTFDKTSVENTDTAVFATDNVTWTVIFGLYGGNKGWSTNVRNGEVTARIPLKDKEKVENSTGTVYVIDRDGFVEDKGGQFRSHESVTPVEKIEVNLKDYFDLG
jgi:hypothetical protein